jgi:hypothetical protein
VVDLNFFVFGKLKGSLILEFETRMASQLRRHNFKKENLVLQNSWFSLKYLIFSFENF